jgi:hypothetical protein
MTSSTALLIALGWLATGCTTDDVVVASGLPGARASANLELLAERGDYLDVMAETGRRKTRYFLPDDAACRSLFKSEVPVTFSNDGVFGRFEADGESCAPVGVLSLTELRDRRPRPRNASIIPRARADLRERTYADEQLVLIRGRFTLASQVGITGGGDLIAVLPNSPECQGLSIPSSVSMEFRPAGPQAFTILNGDVRCAVQGFVQPPAGPA